MVKLPTSLDELSYNTVKVERAELRNGKIIIVIKPNLLSDQVFAVNPYFDEGAKKNQLGEAHFDIKITEKSGSIKASATLGNSLSHFTKGHSQMHFGMKNVFMTKIETAVHEILTSDMDYIGDSKRMNQLIDNLENPEEQEHAKSLIEGRLKRGSAKHIEEKKHLMLEAIKEYEASIIALGDING